MLMRNAGRVILLASGIIFLLSTNVFAISQCTIGWGQNVVSVLCRNEEMVTTVNVEINCTLCHNYKTQSEVQTGIMKYTYESRLRHHLQYFPKNAFVVEEGKNTSSFQRCGSVASLRITSIA